VGIGNSWTAGKFPICQCDLNVLILRSRRDCLHSTWSRFNLGEKPTDIAQDNAPPWIGEILLQLGRSDQRWSIGGFANGYWRPMPSTPCGRALSDKLPEHSAEVRLIWQATTERDFRQCHSFTR
jgi:hypothetical protein